MLEFILMGRGGQGIVVAGDILAKALFYQGYFVKSFPSFGTERRGAPVKAFLRVSHEPITQHYQIYKPDYCIVFDSLQTKGLPDGSYGLVNHNDENENYNLVSLDANHIALKSNLGSQTNPIINTTMLGGVTALIENLDFRNLEIAIKESLPESLWTKNIRAAWEAYHQVYAKLCYKKQWSLNCA